MNAVEFLISVKDMASGAINKIATEFRESKKDSDKLGMSMQELAAKKKKLLDARDTSASISQIRKINKELADTDNQMRRLDGLPPKGFMSRMREMGGGMMGKAAAGIAGVFAINQIGQFGSEVVRVTGSFEKYKVVLGNTFQDMAKGERVMGMITQFAAETPFQVDELTSSYVKLANRGVEPTMAQMRSMGDLAASQGKGFDQLVEAALDAQTGEFERLKEFGIRASKAGDMVSFTFKGQTKTMKMTDAAVQDYIYSLGKVPGVAGGMAAISGTLEGKLSNLTDASDGFKKALGDRLSPLISWTADKMKRMYEWGAKNADVVLILAGALAIVTVAMVSYSVAMWVAAKATDSLTRKIILQNIALLMNPYVLIAMAVIALVAWLVYLYNTNSKVKDTMDAIGRTTVAVFKGFVQWVKDTWAAVKQFATGVWQIFVGLYTPLINLWKWIFGVIGAGFAWVRSIVSDAVSWIGTAMSAVGNWIGGMFSSAWQWIVKLAGLVMQAFDPVVNFVKGIFGGIVDGIKSAFTWVYDNVVKPVLNVGGKALRAVGFDVDLISQGLGNVAGGLKAQSKANDDYKKSVSDAYNGKGVNVGAAADAAKDAKVAPAKAPSNPLNPAVPSSASASSSVSGSSSSGVSIKIGNLIGSITFNGTPGDNAKSLQMQVETAILQILNMAAARG